MDMQMLLYNNHGVHITTSFLEELLFTLSDLGNIRIVSESALVTSAAAVLGGLLGAFAGGRTGAVLGAGLVGAMGYRASTEMTLREAWEMVKAKLIGLLHIILDFLRSLDYMDYIAAAEILVASADRREEVYEIIIQYIVTKLGQVAYRQLQ
ncbi:unnamed protein product [Arctia plantaginis]|uniref:Uncharacterized protein n=1 Tax=Arctia plantaginis TaxID=874455 RepID=A0A8S0ZJ80_ARCPL|nr:unnamed protein product [Arctia plantaginis]